MIRLLVEEHNTDIVRTFIKKKCQERKEAHEASLQTSNTSADEICAVMHLFVSFGAAPTCRLNKKQPPQPPRERENAKAEAPSDNMPSTTC